MDYYYFGFNPLFGFLDLIWHIALVFLVIWFIIWLFRGGRSRRMNMWHDWQAHSALSILNERFAKGEISKEEYEERKKTLLS